jgi:hypothetical protein
VIMSFLDWVFGHARPGSPEKLERSIGSAEGILEVLSTGVGPDGTSGYYGQISACPARCRATAGERRQRRVKNRVQETDNSCVETSSQTGCATGRHHPPEFRRG